jgi:hypothetical protein
MPDNGQESFDFMDSDLDRRFSEFHAENPHVYEKLVQLARQAVARGRTRTGIGMLFEVVRWHVYLETNDPDWKMNNSYRSRYARLIMEQEKGLEDLFELRELKT